MKQQLGDLAAEVEQSLPDGVRYPLRVMREINRVLYHVRVQETCSGEAVHNPE